jgi:hemolysin-activating ACP:hemolysin acyltransferase
MGSFNAMNEKYKEDLMSIIELRVRERLDTPAHLLKELYLAAMVGNVEIFKDEFERPAGYVAWARLAKETIQEISKTRQLELDIGSLNEGYFLYVIDVMVGRAPRSILSHVLRHLPIRYRLLLYSRRGRLRAIRIVGNKPHLLKQVELSFDPRVADSPRQTVRHAPAQGMR